jgi:hypothetical protein
MSAFEGKADIARDEALIAIDVSDVLNPATRPLKTCNWVRK